MARERKKKRSMCAEDARKKARRRAKSAVKKETKAEGENALEEMRHTLNCIFCGQPAVSWCGHVVKEGETVLAGTCKPCSFKPFAPGNMELQALPGRLVPPTDYWREEHGIAEDEDGKAGQGLTCTRRKGSSGGKPNGMLPKRQRPGAGD